MALAAPLVQFPNIAAIGIDHSFSNALSAQWQSLRSDRRHRGFYRLARTASTAARRPFSSESAVREAARPILGQDQNISLQPSALPECLRAVPVSQLVFGVGNSSSSTARLFPPLLTFIKSLPLHSESSVPSRSRFPQTSLRPFSTSSLSRPVYSTSLPYPQFRFAPPNRSFSITRAVQSSSQAQNILAHAERTANNNPSSVSAQNAFYTALLRAGHPDIVRERYQTGRYAANEATSAMYVKALESLGKVPAPGSSASPGSISPSQGGLSQQTLQAVGQAVAGEQLTGNATVSGTGGQATGSSTSPLHVTVSESWGTLILRWVKFMVWTAVFAYVVFLVLGVYIEMSGAAGGIRTRAGKSAEVSSSKQTVRFSDVHGCDEAKDELEEVVEFLRNPDRFSNLGGKLPKGVLLIGPPGTGKTLLAKAVAGESGCSFFYMSGSEFDEMYVGVGARRVRELFNQARAKSPAIIFIDELDAVGGKRSERDPSYAKQTLNQLLTELDGFSSSSGVILIGATNYPQSLDPALVRPGRFDRRVIVPLPDVRGRIEILKHHMKNVQISTEVDATVIARGTSGFSGADLENLVNQAAVRASRLKYKKVGPKEFDWAKDKIIMGAENRSRVIRQEDKVMTAYHEAGHALVSIFTPGSAALYKMTIIPRGMSLGANHFLPEMDVVSKAFYEYLADIDVSMGGYAAEELIYGTDKVTSGASHDITQATRTARSLVTEMGFSRKLGNVDLASHYDSLSAETKAIIESEIRSIIDAGHVRAMKILTEKRKELEMLKDALIEYETLTKEEVEKVIKGEKLKKLDDLTLSSSSSEGGDEKKNSDQKDQDKTNKDKGKKSGGGGVIKLPDFVMDGVISPTGNAKK